MNNFIDTHVHTIVVLFNIVPYITSLTFVPTNIVTNVPQTCETLNHKRGRSHMQCDVAKIGNTQYTISIAWMQYLPILRKCQIKSLVYPLPTVGHSVGLAIDLLQRLLWYRIDEKHTFKCASKLNAECTCICKPNTLDETTITWYRQWKISAFPRYTRTVWGSKCRDYRSFRS